MGALAVELDPNDCLDVIGQQLNLNLYTQICSCYAVADASSHSAIIDILTNGLKRLSASFPWVAGKLVNEGATQGNTGTFKIEPLESVPSLVVKDLRNDSSIPTMEALRVADFPISMLDESIVAPRRTLHGRPDAAEPAAVFLVQATFITGGLLLTFIGQHNTMDMTGQAQVISLLSKACHGEQFTHEELTSVNIARRDIIPLLDSTYEQGPELANQIVKPPPSNAMSQSDNVHQAPPAPPRSLWAYVSFSSASLNALKSLAQKSIASTSAYVSTDDALTAFLWQSIARARLPRLDPASESKLARAVDVRRFLNISHMYPGMMQNMTYHASNLKKLTEAPLGNVASDLRSALDPKTSHLAYNTRALATALTRSPDKSIMNFTATLDTSADIMLSSWSRLDSFDLDFNLGLGKPECVRRPRFDPVESLIYLMPKSLDGEIAVALCLREEDMARLRADPDFTKYARYVG